MRQGGFLLLVCGGALLVLVSRGAWREPPRTREVFAESRAIAERMLAEHLARDGRRPTIGDPQGDGDARAIYEAVLPRLASLGERELDALRRVSSLLHAHDTTGEDAAAALAKTRPLLAELRAVLTAPRKSPRDPWQGTADPVWDYLGHWLRLAEVVEAHAWTHVRRNEVDAALDLCVLLWYAGLDFARDGLMADALVGRALARKSANLVRWILAHGEVDPRRLDRLAAELDVLRAAAPPDNDCLRVETYWLRRALDAMGPEPLAGVPSEHRADWITWRLFADTLAGLAPGFERVFAAMDGHCAQHGVERAEALVDEIAPASRPILRMIFVVVPLVMSQPARLAMRETLLRVVVALARYRARHGRDAPDLQALVPDLLPAVPDCPWTGKPLGYAPGKVWSVGSDGDDDAGRPVYDDEARDADGDVLFTLATQALRTFPWPDDVGPDARERIDEAIGRLHRGGGEGAEAADQLAREKTDIGGRLVSELARIDEDSGLDTPLGRARAGRIDEVLRRRDAFMVDRWRSREGIEASSEAALVRRTAVRWTNWWASGDWKTDPRAPDAYR